MYDLSYFNLGFRSDSVSNYLIKLRSANVINHTLLEDAFSIIMDCLRIGDDDVLISSLSPGTGYQMNKLIPLIAELYVGKDLTSIVADLKKIHKIILQAKENSETISNADYDHATNFFSNLADLCLSNSVHQSLINNSSSL